MSDQAMVPVQKGGPLRPSDHYIDAVVVQPSWLDAKRTELAKAEAAHQALVNLKATPRRKGLAMERVKFLRRVVTAMERGFVPLPRFDSETLQLDVEELPVVALQQLAAAKRTHAFDEVRFVRGRAPDSRPRSGFTRRRVATRDPLLVGVIRTTEHRIPVKPTSANLWNDMAIIPAREEHFLIAWWRPEDERDEEMF